MEIALEWSAVAVGIVGALFGLASGSSKDERKPDIRAVWIVAFVSALVANLLFIITKPSSPPFAAGERLGLGVLLGGILGAIAGLVCAKAGKMHPRTTFSAIGVASLSLLGTGLILFFFSGYPQPALIGFVIGAITSSVFFKFGVPNIRGIEYYAFFSAGLCASTILAILRYDAGVDRIFWRAPLVIGTIAVAACFGSIGKASRVFVQATTSSLILVIVAAILAWNIFNSPKVLACAILGILVFGLTALLQNAQLKSSAASAGAAFCILAYSAAAFHFLGGFGIGLGLIAAWAILIPALAVCFGEEKSVEQTAASLKLAAFFAIGALAYRLFFEYYGAELRGPDFREHYTFIAFLVGAMLPFGLRSFAPVCINRGLKAKLIASGGSGVFAAAIPLAILAVWGFKAAFGFLIGTTAAQLFSMFITSSAIGDKAKGYIEYALYVLGAQWALFSFAGLIGPVAQNARTTRLAILVSVTIAGSIWAWIASRLDTSEG